MLRQGAQTGCSVRRLAESRTLLFLAALSGGSDAFPLLHHRTGRLTWTRPTGTGSFAGCYINREVVFAEFPPTSELFKQIRLFYGSNMLLTN